MTEQQTDTTWRDGDPDRISKPEDVVDETEQTGETTDEQAEPETFPREYVQQLRDENAKYRQRAGRSDDLAARLHTALVTATGRLADPSDLPYDEAHVDDAEALAAAIDDLIARKPHLATRRPSGDVGQGATPDVGSVSLAGILRNAAN